MATNLKLTSGQRETAWRGVTSGAWTNRVNVRGFIQRSSLLIATLALIAGCVQVPPSPAETQAKRFESVPGKAVIYIVRPNPGYDGHGTIALDDSIVITMFGGNFFRWEVAPGTHRIAGKAQDVSRLTLNTEAGKVYFVRHTVLGSNGRTWGGSLDILTEQDGQALVLRATLLGTG